MSRTTAIYTAIGLMGLVVAMAAALNEGVPPVGIATGFAMMAVGTLGAVIGAAVTLSRAWQMSR